MDDEPDSDRDRLCHVPDSFGSDGLPDGTWCLLVVELWWRLASRSPHQALAAMEHAGRYVIRRPGGACPVRGCARRHVGAAESKEAS